MPEALARLQQQALQVWAEMDKSQKTRMIIISILVVASLTIGIFIITRPNYENLFSGRLDPKEVGEISDILKENRIDYKLADAGSMIQVRAKDQDQARIVLSQSGYPKGGMTFKDALSSIKLSTTESDKKKIFKEYDEQKIANSLKKIDEIRDAVVNLSLPEKDIFFGDSTQQAPSAAVLIEATSTLSKKQIEGIARFVAASVEGLDVKYVKIIDKATGNMLNDGWGEEIAGNTSRQYEYQAALKKEKEDKVRELLGNMYDGIRVGANIVCDFDTQTTKEVQYTPVVGDDSGILRSSQAVKEEVQNGATGGVPGTDSNTSSNTTPSYPAGESAGSSYKKSDITNNYEINQRNIESTKAPGQMDSEKSSITVSLLYGKNVTNPPVQDEISTLTRMIANATGITEKNITIASFKLPEVKAVPPKTDWMKLLGQIGPIAVLGVLIILLAVGVLRKGSTAGGNLAVNGPPIRTVGLAAQQDFEDLPEIELEEKSEVKRQIDRFVKRKPDAVAQLLRNWLADEWD